MRPRGPLQLVGFAVDIRGTLTKWRRKVDRMRRGVRLTCRRCADEKKDGSRSGTKWSIHFFQLSRTTDGRLRVQQSERTGGERGETDGRRKDIRHFRGKTKWHLNRCPSVKLERELCLDKALPDEARLLHVELSENPRLPAALRQPVHSISIGGSQRGYLYSE